MPYPNHWFSTDYEKAALLEISKYIAYSADLFQWRFENTLSPVCRSTSDGGVGRLLSVSGSSVLLFPGHRTLFPWK